MFLQESYRKLHPRLPVVVAETLLHTDPYIELPLWLVHIFKVLFLAEKCPGNFVHHITVVSATGTTLCSEKFHPLSYLFSIWVNVSEASISFDYNKIGSGHQHDSVVRKVDLIS